METSAQQESGKANLIISLRNLGTTNKNKVVFKTNKGEIELYFSYETIVGFEFHTQGEYKKVVIQNLWSTTTGKLLNQIEPDKSKRVSQEQLSQALNECLAKLF